MSEKKEGKKGDKAAAAQKAAPAKKAKVHPSELVKRNPDGTKVMKVARGTERRRRREGLKRDWKNHPNVPQMKPSKAQEAQTAKAA